MLIKNNIIYYGNDECLRYNPYSFFYLGYKCVVRVYFYIGHCQEVCKLICLLTYKHRNCRVFNILKTIKNNYYSDKYKQLQANKNISL